MLAHWPLEMLLGSADHGRLPGKDLLQQTQELGSASTIPHVRPVTQIRVVDPTVHTHMLAGPHHHVFSRNHIHHGRMLREVVRNT